MLVGNAALLRESGVALESAVEDGGRTPVHVAVDGQFASVIFIADTLRPGARQALAELKASGVKRIVMLTDDLGKIAAARAIARRAYRTVQENLFVGVGVVRVLGITAALLGWIGPIQAAIIHLGPDILVFVNSVICSRFASKARRSPAPKPVPGASSKRRLCKPVKYFGCE